MKLSSPFFIKALSNATFWVALISVSFAYPFPSQLPKYLLFVLSILVIGFSYKKVFSKDGWTDFLEFFKPWIPWFLSVTVLCIIYGTSGFSRYVNTFLILILVFLALRTTSYNKERLLYFFAVSSIVISLSILIYIYYYGLSPYIFDYNKNKLMYPVTMIGVCCLVALMTDYRDLPRRLLILLFLGVASFIFALVFSEVRGALLGLLALIPVAIIYSKRLSKKVLIGFAILVTVTIVLFLMTGRLQEGVNDLRKVFAGNMNSSWGIRLVLWKTSLESFLASPWIGWGAESYRTYSVSGFMTTPLPKFIEFTHFHSDFFQLLAVGGLVMISGWLITCAWLAWTVRHDPYRLSLIISSLAMGLTEPCWAIWLSLFTFALLWILFTLRSDLVSKKSE